MTKRVQWKESEIRNLIALWGSPEFRDKIEVRNWRTSNVNKIGVYNEIAEKLSELGHPRKEGTHIQTKIKGLRCAYKAVQDKMNKSGAGTEHEFLYYEEISNIIGHRPNINPTPQAIGDSLAPNEVGLAGNRSSMSQPRKRHDSDAHCQQTPRSGNSSSSSSSRGSQSAVLQEDTPRTSRQNEDQNRNKHRFASLPKRIPMRRPPTPNSESESESVCHGMIREFADWYGPPDDDVSRSDFSPETLEDTVTDTITDTVTDTPIEETNLEQPLPSSEEQDDAEIEGKKRKLSGSKKDRTVDALSKKIKENSDSNWKRMSSLYDRARREDRQDRVEELGVMRGLTSVLEKNLEERKVERRERREDMLEERRSRSTMMNQLLTALTHQNNVPQNNVPQNNVPQYNPHYGQYGQYQ